MTDSRRLPEKLPRATARPEMREGEASRYDRESLVLDRTRVNLRRPRFFDAKIRTIGVDKQALDAQVLEKLARLYADREKEKTVERGVMEAHEELAKREMERHNSRRATQAELRAALAKQVSERLEGEAGGEDTSVVEYGPSSVQVLDGEDEGKAVRQREQQKQQRDALEQQMFEKMLRKERMAEVESSPAAPYGGLAGPKEEIAARARRLARETLEANRKLAEAAALRHFAARDAEEAAGEAMLEYMADGRRFINEPPTEKLDGGRRYRKDGYRGAPPDAEGRVKDFRDRQVEAARKQSAAEGAVAAAEAWAREEERRAAVRNMARRHRDKTVALKGVAYENARAAARRKEEPPLVAVQGEVKDEFFEQFGKSTLC
ncbi:hypothetical protein FOZ60_007978 [Perkinsus olseni]|uniref:Uncharacterized protein n=1 Tax=Perkinsus olseni TaxID=32597 RepID=A0A7J6NLM9_PEROL|nr:hypothetical protein FOZ60_007978 [Perkinsus olseni]